MRDRTDIRPDRLLASVAFTGALLLAVFWILYAGGAIELGEPGGPASLFEAAFPAADAMLGLILIVAGIGLWRGRGYGLFAMIAGGAMTLYLGVLDLTFYTRQGFYTPLHGEALLELTVNLICVGGGVWSLLRSWRAWRTS